MHIAANKACWRRCRCMLTWLSCFWCWWHRPLWDTTSCHLASRAAAALPWHQQQQSEAHLHKQHVQFSKAVRLGLQQSPLLGALSVQALCQHIQAICLLATVRLLLVHHRPHCLAAPALQHCTSPSIAEVTALPCSMLNKHALPLQMCLHLGLCSLAQLTLASTIRLEGKAWHGLTNNNLCQESYLAMLMHNYIECSCR